MTSPIPLSPSGLVIVGSGLAGYSLAREWRKLSPEAPLTIVSADDGASYSKPMLSNAYGQKKSLTALVMKSAEQMAHDLKATVLTHSTVQKIDRAAHQVIVQTADGESLTLSYTALVLAVGASARAYALPNNTAGAVVQTVNSLDDYRRWRATLEALPADRRRVLLIGGGLIGCEFANDLASAGYAVTVVDPAPWPLGRLLPEALGTAVREALSGIGIAVEMNTSVTGVSASAESSGIAHLANGRDVPFDAALSAIGLVANVGLAKDAGLVVDRGIVVDALLRSSDPSLYALGDCAQSPAGLQPFVLPLMAQAKALAQTLSGRETPLHLPAMPVVVKTPCLPVVVCPPPFAAVGEWQVSGSGQDLKALFVQADGTALGFALSGAPTSERQALAKEMPDIL